MRSSHARYEFKRENFKQRILRTLNLEDTPRNHPAPSRLSDREASPIPATTWKPFPRRSALRQRQAKECAAKFALLQQSASDARATSSCRGALHHEIQKLARRSPGMSAINGDKSRFHRERKQNIARRKRTRELLAAAARKVKSIEAPVSAKPKAVPS